MFTWEQAWSDWKFTVARNTFRIALRRFGPFESAIQKHWDSFCAKSGCPLRLEAEAFDLPSLFQTTFEQSALREGAWDASMLVSDWLAEADASGSLLDLAPFLKNAPPEDYPEGWADSLLRSQQIDGRILGLPFHDGPECLVYRRDLFEEAGIAVPKTWDEFRSAARGLARPREKRWGTVFAAFPDGHNSVYDFCLQLWSRGGELFDRSGRLALDTPPAREALTFYRAMMNDPMATHPDSRSMDSVQSGFAFTRGEVAMMVNWFGYAAMGETLPESAVRGRVAVAPLPSAPGHAGVSLNVFWLLGIGRGSPHAGVAYDFLRHCAGREQDKLLTLEGAIGCRRSTWRDAEVNRVIPFYHELEAIHANARELPRLANWSQVAGVIDRLVTQVIATSRPVDDLCREASEDAARRA
jgi:multiple sugar transport system substrate-binding protein